MIIVLLKAGLGNQLFQYATGRALSIKLQTELKIDLTFYDNPINSRLLRLDIFSLPYSIAQNTEIKKFKNKTSNYLIRKLNTLGLELYSYNKPSHIFEKDLLSIVNYEKDYYIEGWFADQCFFKEYRPLILKDLNNETLISRNYNPVLYLIENTNSVSVHIRRGDYLLLDYFYDLPIDYYLKAIGLLRKKINNPNFFFFSDDISWVKKSFAHIDNSFFVEGCNVSDQQGRNISDLSELMLMKKCKHNIIANSTYSWWGAWLNTNKEKIIIAPKKWFNDIRAEKKYQEGSIVPNNWIKI